MTAPKQLPSVFAAGQVVRFADYERRSRNPDAVSPRDPSESAVIIILPVIRRFDGGPAPREEIWR